MSRLNISIVEDAALTCFAELSAPFEARLWSRWTPRDRRGLAIQMAFT